MPQVLEPFFTPGELKATVLFRPKKWRGWWNTEPTATKMLVGFIGVVLLVGTYAVLGGNAALGYALLITGAGVLSIPTVYSLGNLLVPCIRWLLRRIGIAAIWRKIRTRVIATAKALFWIYLVVGLLWIFWPFLSFDPVKTYYALKYEVPVVDVGIDKVPHDCEFSTAPIGSKHCHYEAKVLLLKPNESSSGRKFLAVAYERVEE